MLRQENGARVWFNASWNQTLGTEMGWSQYPIPAMRLESWFGDGAAPVF
jgi:hypothetical protein